MKTLVKELSYHEAQSANGGERTYDGGTLPEVVCVGHKKVGGTNL